MLASRCAIIIFIFIAFIQNIYNYIPETNHVSTVYRVVAVLYLHFALHVMLFRMLTMFCTFTSVLSEVCAQCPVAAFSSYLTSYFLSTLLRYCRYDCEMVPVAHIVTVITFVITLNSSFILNFKFILVYLLLGGGLLVTAALNNRSMRYTPALCSAH